ncbi:signal peptidase II [Sphingorhabdus sp.]|jgi:signal peptidase II|uniref:signal peptidase II n=1 Tax=Sphingorhabdus sp. TaxID=1902408 RepID=UPI0037CA6CC4
MNPNSKFRLQGIMLASLVFIADQIVKYAMLGPLQLKSRGVIHIISFFDLRYAENRGVSMSFLTADNDGERWALVALTAVITAGVAVWMWREKLRGDVLALSLVLGGALGNIVDRVRYGYVVDYADLHIGAFRPFYIFNLADACISIGVLILLARAFLISDKQSGDGADVQQPESSADIVEKS